MATSLPQRRRVRLPRPVPLVEPISSVDGPFHRSGSFYVRVGGLGVLAVLVFSLLGLRLWSLQVLKGADYGKVALRQSFRTVDLPAARGAIVDARGRLLAGTDGHPVVTVDADALGRLDERGQWTPTTAGYRILQRLGRLAGGVHAPLLVRRIRAELVRSPFAPAVVLPHTTPGLTFFLDERAARFPGVHVTSLPARSYPQGSLGGEFLGLLGEIGPSQIASARYPGAKAGQVVGQSGIEARYDRILDGGFQKARVQVDSLGRMVGPLRVSAAGKQLPTVQLTIDARLQRVAEKAIRDGIAAAHANGHADASAGAAVVMNARTGALYALASYPTFSQVAAARNPAYLQRLLRGTPGLPMLNRATQGVYPTGSTFKPIVAEAALSSGLITPSTSLLCSGAFTIGGFTFHNVEAGVFSYMSLPTALAESCDTWFYRLGDRFFFQGGTVMQNWAHRLGLGHRTGVDLTGEAGGVVPTPQWLRRTWHQQWYEGQTINLSIGQGYLAVTPLQLAVAYATLANGGTVVRPHVARALLRGDAVQPLRAKPLRHVKLRDLWAIREGLYEAAHSPNGTSSSVFGDFPIPIAGKTGTAQTPTGSDHSWYASWAPAAHPRVVVVVLIEHGGFGAQAAAPAAKEIYSSFFRVRAQRPARRH